MISFFLLLWISTCQSTEFPIQKLKGSTSLRGLLYIAERHSFILSHASCTLPGLQNFQKSPWKRLALLRIYKKFLTKGILSKCKDCFIWMFLNRKLVLFVCLFVGMTVKISPQFLLCYWNRGWSFREAGKNIIKKSDWRDSLQVIN